MNKYPQIERLKRYLKDFEINIEKIDDADNKPDAFWVNVIINNQSWKIFIDDEYQHFNNKNPLINLYLTLVAMEVYKDSDDFLVWCKELGLDTSEVKRLDYYKSLDNIYNEIEMVLGKIDSEVSYFDYSLQTGVGKALVDEVNSIF